MPRALLFLAWPLIEIGLFVVIGGWIGLGATLAWVVLTGIVGVVLLRSAAARGATLLRGGAGRAALREGAPVAGLMRALAAVLLILPGFLTDAMGLLLLLPPVQALISGAVMSRITVMAGQKMQAAGFGRGQSAGKAGNDVVEGEWVEVPPEANRNRPSRWTEIE